MTTILKNSSSDDFRVEPDAPAVYLLEVLLPPEDLSLRLEPFSPEHEINKRRFQSIYDRLQLPSLK